jgi:flavin reductase (DIM6/NTAB) family NADH-FMN oxidoreductase RutF
MAISSEEFRAALRLYPSGVTVVTIRVGDVVHGLTVSAFASVSPEPPLVAVIIDHRHRGYELLERDGARFAVNFLAEDQAEISNRFAWQPDDERFDAERWDFSGPGAPLLREALGWLDCRVHSRFPAGTHTVYIGEVERAGHRELEHEVEAGSPLIYWNREYRGLRGAS